VHCGTQQQLRGIGAGPAAIAVKRVLGCPLLGRTVRLRLRRSLLSGGLILAAPAEPRPQALPQRDRV